MVARNRLGVHNFRRNLLEFLMRKLLAGLLLVALGFGYSPQANAWDLSVPADADTLVRTYFNPVFGPFDEFTLPKNDQKSWDIQNHGVFFLNIYCSQEKYLVLTKYQKWSMEKSEWETMPFPKLTNLSLRFGSAKAISWGVKTEQDVDGLVFTNPKVFVKKVSGAKSLDYQIKSDGKLYKVKFNTAGFSNYLPDLKDAGC